MHIRFSHPSFRLLALTANCLLAAGIVLAGDPPPAAPVVVGPESVSAPVTPSSFDGDTRDLPPPPGWNPGDPIREIPRRFYPDASQELAHAPPWLKPDSDPLVAKQAAVPHGHAVTAFGTTIINIAGNPNQPLSPPDVAGDVGANHFIQAINGSAGSLVQIYAKATGATIGAAFSMVSLGGTGACTSTFGDPIVLYDRPADRWFLLEFSSAGNGLCVHVSKTPDPVAGGWWNYTFVQATFPDYPHCSVWWDAYYCTANEGNPPVYAFDRTKMLAGAAATQQTFRAAKLAGYGFQALTPADFMGATAPPAGAEFIMARHDDDEAHAGAAADPTKDFIDMFSMHTDWVTPANSTFTTLPRVAISEFNSWFLDYATFATVPQPGSASKLDPIREVILNRANYRNFTTYEAIVGAFATNIDPAISGSVVKSGVRWFELRRTPVGTGPWTLYQEGTYGDASGTKHVLEGTIAMDQSGNIALGFNVTQTSAPNIFASIKYSGRLSTDPLGTMPQGENTVILGSAAEASGRWGDYASMGVDPVDDCTFWFTHEYRPAGGWATQIASFKFTQCGGCAAPSGLANNTAADVSACASSGITVTWTAPTTWGDSVTTGRSYTVLRDGVAVAAGPCSGALPTTTLSCVDTPGDALAHTYTVRANNSCGLSLTTAGATATDVNNSAGAPTAVSATTASCANVVVTWTNGTGATSHNLLRYNGACPSVAGLVTNTGAASPFTDATAAAGSSYCYVAQAQNACGTTNAAGVTGTRAAAAAVPGAPTATATCAGINLTWTAASGATTYNVLRNAVQIATGIAATSYSDTTAVAGTAYVYTLQSVSGCGTSATGPGSASTTRPASPAPTVTGLTSGCASVALSTQLFTTYQWQLGGVNIGGATAQNYSATATGNYTVVTTNAAGCSGTSPAQAVTVTNTPAAPVQNAAAPGNTQITVNWSASAGATGYQVKRGPTGGPYVNVGPLQAGTSYLDTGLTNGTQYCYVLTAGNGCGTSGNSNQQCATPAACSTAPTFAGATSATNSAQSNCTVTVAWAAGTATCTGATLTYNVYRSTTTPFTPGAGNLIASGVSASPYTDSVGLTNGVIYYYTVRAVDNLGNSDANVIVRSTAPTGPAGLGTFAETFEGGAGAPVNAGWVVNNVLAGAAAPWVGNTVTTHAGTGSRFDADDAARSEHAYESPAMTINAGSVLSFWHTWSFENGTNIANCTTACYDGGVLEYQLGAGAWTRLTGAQITGATYNGLIDNNAAPATDNPLGAQIPAFVGGTGTVPAFTQATVSIGAITGAGSVKVRWLQSDDTANGATSPVGWYLDDVQVTNVSGTPTACITCSGAATAMSLVTHAKSGTDLVESWPTVAGASTYNIYRNPAPASPATWTAAATGIAVATWSDVAQLGNATSQFYSVTDLNSCGIESPK